MKTINLENADVVSDLFEEAWTEEGAIVIYPYQDNKIQLLSKEDLKDSNLINSIYANEDVALFDTACFSQVEGYQNLLRDLFKQYINVTEDLIADFGVSLENQERLDRYKSIYKVIGGK